MVPPIIPVICDRGDDIVISGLSGTFPCSKNVYEFRDNLLKKRDLITLNTESYVDHEEMPKYGGFIPDKDRFDAPFFRLYFNEANVMQPQARMLLEKTYEAIVDAGLNPRELKNTRTGVYIADAFPSVSPKLHQSRELHIMNAVAPSMVASRINYWLGINGPSYIMDTACSTSSYCLESAYQDMKSGKCDMAIVGGSNICIHSSISIQFTRLGVLNKDGKCKCFDETADGYTRAETVAVLFLQKAKDAKRIYAKIVNMKSNCDGYKEEGLTFPSTGVQTVLMKEFYEECGISPLNIQYVEAHGTGTRIGDPEEAESINNVFCSAERKEPLLIGSVKSNMGHSETASGLCSITKVILTMEENCLIPNINFKTPRKSIKALQDGRMKIVTELTPWHGSLIPVNNFGFGGANSHLLLETNPKLKINYGLPKDNIPRLVYVSGRTETGINTIFDNLSKRRLDVEYIGLLHEVFKYNIPGHSYRGYAIFTKNEVITRTLNTYLYDNEPKPLWFVFSGLGTEWPSMGAGLMQIPTFAQTIRKCHLVLEPKDIDIVDLLTNPAPATLTNLTKSFVAITALQMGICDILTTADIKPAGVIGYSIGEIAAAYYDGCLSLDQAILTAFYFGQAADTSKIVGTMINVDLGEAQVEDYQVKGVDIACYNGKQNYTFAGPTDRINELIKILQNNRIAYKKLKTHNIPLHSNYTKDIAVSILKKIKPLIPIPNTRSNKWISSTTLTSQLCTAEYLSQLLVGPVVFKDAYDRVPEDSINFEISPQGLLQNVLKRCEYDECINIAAMEKEVDGLNVFLSAVGNLYIAGQNPRMEQIYPKIEFPVSKGTPMLSPYIRWDHSLEYELNKSRFASTYDTGERRVNVNISKKETEYVTGHMIDGRILYPATGYLVLVWETISMTHGQTYDRTSVVFENVQFHRATNMPKDETIEFIITIQSITGIFEVQESGELVVSGRVYIPDNINENLAVFPLPVPDTKDYYLPLESRDIYKELRLRGYNYSGLFRSLHSCDTTATTAEIYWHNNWVPFLDTILQLQILQKDTRGLFVPTVIQHLSIDAEKHQVALRNLNEENTLSAYAYKSMKTICCGGVRITGLGANAIARKRNLGEPVLETYKFIPNKITTKYRLEQSVRIMVHVVLENIQLLKVKTAELIENETFDETKLLSPIVHQVLSDLPLIQSDVTVLSSKPFELNGISVSNTKLTSGANYLLVIVENALKQPQILSNAFNAITTEGFILTRESISTDLSTIDQTQYQIILNHKLDQERIVLLCKLDQIKYKTYINITNSTQNKLDWLPRLQESIKLDPNTVIYSQGDATNGIIGLVNCIRKEPGLDGVRCVFVMDENAPKFDPENEFYSRQLKKGLAVNVLRNGKWGTYRHLLLEENEFVDVEHAYVNVTVRGDLTSLRWLEGEITKDVQLKNSQNLVHVYNSALNFRDIMTATGRIAAEVVGEGRFHTQCVQGLEYSGRLLNGRRVFGIIKYKALATMVQADPLFTWFVPDEWTMEDAASVPVVYTTVLYALVIEGKMNPGMSVLIHAGTGGVGQAAINIALHYGCTVYTTVGTPEKREFIKKRWPQIKDNQIGNSRDCSFENMIQKETCGRGVDLILNSLAEEKLLASVRCLAVNGKFLEIGKFDLTKDNPLPLKTFAKNASFHGIMLDRLFFNESPLKNQLNKLIMQLIKEGAVKPISRHVFQTDELEEAHRFMAAGKHIGKVIIRVKDEEPEQIFAPEIKLMKAIPRYMPTTTGSYIITGGLGGFGLELVDWLILRGAQKLVLTSRKGITTGYQAFRLKMWRSYGIDLVISTEDITTKEGCRNLIEQARALGPVEGIFNLAVVIRDALFENQTAEDFQASLNPKAIATKYLDELSRSLCPNIRQFVIFSSVSCGRGNVGQTNYGMANSVMERICEQRKENGFPALAIQWGAVGDVGLVAEMQEEHTEVVIGGTLQQRITNCLSVMDKFLRQSDPIVSSMVVAEKRAGDGSSENVVDAILNILGVRDKKSVSSHSTLTEIGMDSIMSVEIKQTLERELEIILSPQDVRELTLAKMQEMATKTNANSYPTEMSPGDIEIPKMGIQAMIRTIGDEETARESSIILPSAATKDCTDQIYLIPGIEGMASVLEPLAKHLVITPICLQLGFETSVATIQGMAQLLLERSTEYFPDSSSTFTLVGYSYGSVIALEMASILESRGKIGRVVLIDGSPNMIKTLIHQQIKSEEEGHIQNSVLNLITNLIFEAKQAVFLQSQYEPMEFWQDKVNTIMKSVQNVNTHSETYLKSIVETIYCRFKAILNYNQTVVKLKSTIKLIKPQDATVVMAEEDFGLSAFTNKPVEIVYCEGNHVTILDNPDCAKEVNKTSCYLQKN